MMLLGKLKVESTIDDANSGGSGAHGNSGLCDSSSFDCSFGGGGDGGGGG